jgi:mannose-6-phosphate isomerase-like protein (cupin superfamily)
MLLSAPNASLVLAEWADAGGGTDPPVDIAPLHIHHDDDEAWYVLEGALTVRVGDEDVHVAAGSGVLVPRGIVHTYWNPAPEPTRYLLVMTRRIHALIEALHAGGGASVDDTFRAHASEYLGWP